MKTPNPCSVCGCRVDFDYIVSNTFWDMIVPHKYHLKVVCLHCLDEMATEKGEDICDHIENIYYSGVNKTMKLTPKVMFSFKAKTPGVIRKGTNHMD